MFNSLGPSENTSLIAIVVAGHFENPKRRAVLIWVLIWGLIWGLIFFYTGRHLVLVEDLLAHCVGLQKKKEL